MTETSQIPYLVRLLDDDNPEILRKVVEELYSFGPNLKKEIDRHNLSLNDVQSDYLKKLFRYQKYQQLKQNWPGWFSVPCEYTQLETALTIIGECLGDDTSHTKLGSLLDGLAFQYKELYGEADAKLLARFLFEEKKIKGNEEDYYNPQNSNLVHVILKKKGIPISLTCIYMLVGKRLGLHIEGCHFPGHFLARIRDGKNYYFIDCYSNGQVIEEKAIFNLHRTTIDELETILETKATAETIVCRYLANIIRSYQLQMVEEGEADVKADNAPHQPGPAQDDRLPVLDSSEAERQLMIALFQTLESHLNMEQMGDITPEGIINARKPKFSSGQLVHHRKYGYRGIIVDHDPYCQATDHWYYGNPTQPLRNQPWYHVLVHGSDQVTYVAEANLALDSSKDLIEHPLLSYFFVRNASGKYIRNDNPWPEPEF